MKRILTGDRPTGSLHIGHYFGSLRNRIMMQDDYETFILIADVQALTDNFNTPGKVRNNIMELAFDYLAVGIDPAKTIIALQSKLPAIAELTVFFSNLISIARLSRNPTVKEEIKQKKDLFGESVSYGFLGYPVSQAADILSFDADTVPAGDDQHPMIETAREIARRFNSIYGNTFKEPEGCIPEHYSRIKGLDGMDKMGKSMGNAIFLNDRDETISSKVMSAFTDPQKIRKSDPGHPEGCMVYYYLGLFSERLPLLLPDIEKECKSGQRGCVYCKKQLIEIVISFIAPIREKRKIYENKQDDVTDMLIHGTEISVEITNHKLEEAKSRMKIDYDHIFKRGL